MGIFFLDEKRKIPSNRCRTVRTGRSIFAYALGWVLL